MKKTKNISFKIVSLIIVITLAILSVPNVNAIESIVSDLVNISVKEEKLYEEYQLSDLPAVVSSSVNSTEKTPVEIINQDVDDEYTITVKNDDGTNTVHIFQTPIKYVDDETIKLKKDTLVESSENISLFKNYAYESVDNEVKSYYPENISDGIKMEYDDYSVSLTPILTSTQNITRSTQASTVSKIENSVLYTGTFDSNISLEYVPSLNGVKENIIINEYNSINTFEFTIDTDGLIPAKFEGDSIPLLDPTTDEMKFYIGQINARDSYVGNNENNETHFTLYNSLKLEETAIENIYKLIVIVDKEFLESETTVYPVTVDPTITISSSNVADAPVYSGYPNTNYYTNEYNMVGYHGSSYQEAMTFVKLNSLSTYKYVNPEKVNLAYYRVYEGSGKTSTATVNLYDTISTWSESTITYSNKPSIMSTPESSNTISESGWYLFSITDLFTNWLRSALGEGGFSLNYGFALATDTTGVSSRHFASANSTNFLPSIVFNYSEDTSISDGAYYIRSKYSNLYLDTEQDSSANGNVIQYNFHGNGNQVWVVKYQGDGYYKLHSLWHDEDKCLDVENNPTQNGSNVDVFEDSENADWLLFKLVSNNDGTYRIISKWSDNQKVLDVCGPSTSATANIQIWEYMGVNQQKWYFESITPTIVSREEWGAAPFTLEGGDTGEIKIDGQIISNPTEEDLKEFYDTIVIHHTTRPANEAMVDLQASQMDDPFSTFSDVGYHFAINADGTIYEGREIFRNGAHVGGQNSHKIGIVLMGNLHPSFDFNAEPTRPTESQIVSLQRLIGWLNYKYGIDSVKKHKDLDPETVCPGQYAEEDLANRFVFR